MPRYKIYCTGTDDNYWGLSGAHDDLGQEEIAATSALEAAELAMPCPSVGPDLEYAVEELSLCLYLAGPMTNHPHFNFPLFDETALALRLLGYEIRSPAELDDPKTRAAALASPDGAPGSGSPNGDTWGDFLARDVKLIADGVDGVVVMPEWWTSKGARLEVYCAHLSGKPVYHVLNLLDDDDCSLMALDAEEIEEGVHGTPPDDRSGTAWDFDALRDHWKLNPPAVADLVRPELEAKLEAKFESEFVRAVLFGDEAADLPHPSDWVPTTFEERITSETGGQKGRKPERLDLVPPEFTWLLGRVFAMGAEKYDDNNYLKGYDWSLSYAAGKRHWEQWWNGQDLDDESGLNHLGHAAWHLVALYMFQLHSLGTDDRLGTVLRELGIEPEQIGKTGRSEEAR